MGITANPMTGKIGDEPMTGPSWQSYDRNKSSYGDGMTSQPQRSAAASNMYWTAYTVLQNIFHHIDSIIIIIITHLIIELRRIY